MGCQNFFEYRLREKGNFDAVVTNPPWGESVLKVFLQILTVSQKTRRPYTGFARYKAHHLFQKLVIVVTETLSKK